MRILVNTLATIGLAALLLGCGGSKKEDTTPASTESGEAAPAEGEGGGEEAPAEGEAAPAEGEGEGAEAPAEGGGGW